MSHSWLQRQRKAQLLDLFELAGLEHDDETRKDEMVEKLHEHLQMNRSRLEHEPAFQGYFNPRQTPGRPARASTVDHLPESAGDAVDTVRSRGRRMIKVKQELEDGEDGNSSPMQNAIASAGHIMSHLSPSGQLNPRTPTLRSSSRRQSQIPGPPSPAAVAELAEDASRSLAAGVNNLWTASGIHERTNELRTLLSSLLGVHLTVLLLEAIALQREIFPWQFAFDIPASRITPAQAVFVPNLFILLTGFFWSTALTWSLTSIFIPLLFAYFYNLTIRDMKRGNMRIPVARYAADPLTYNVVKALLTWMVFKKGVTFAFITPEAVDRVEHGIWGGSTAMLIGSGIGAIGAFYESTQRRVISLTRSDSTAAGIVGIVEP